VDCRLWAVGPLRKCTSPVEGSIPLSLWNIPSVHDHRISGPDRLVYINLLAAAQPGLRLCVDPRRYITKHMVCRGRGRPKMMRLKMMGSGDIVHFIHECHQSHQFEAVPPFVHSCSIASKSGPPGVMKLIATTLQVPASNARQLVCSTTYAAGSYPKGGCPASTMRQELG
jgi:hypothetical protein